MKPCFFGRVFRRTPSPGPRRLEKAPAAVHPHPEGEGRVSRLRLQGRAALQKRAPNRNKPNFDVALVITAFSLEANLGMFLPLGGISMTDSNNSYVLSDYFLHKFPLLFCLTKVIDLCSNTARVSYRNPPLLVWIRVNPA